MCQNLKFSIRSPLILLNSNEYKSCGPNLSSWSSSIIPGMKSEDTLLQSISVFVPKVDIFIFSHVILHFQVFAHLLSLRWLETSLHPLHNPTQFNWIGKLQNIAICVQYRCYKQLMPKHGSLQYLCPGCQTIFNPQYPNIMYFNKIP